MAGLSAYWHIIREMAVTDHDTPAGAHSSSQLRWHHKMNKDQDEHYRQLGLIISRSLNLQYICTSNLPLSARYMNLDRAKMLQCLV